jgi:hypothetical protein
MHGVAPHMCGRVGSPLLGGGAGGRSPGFIITVKNLATPGAGKAVAATSRRLHRLFPRSSGGKRRSVIAAGLRRALRFERDRRYGS